MKRPVPEKTRPGEESVWDYPRPPRLEPVSKNLKVIFNGEVIADTHHGFRVLETSHPPVYYFPPEDVKKEVLHHSDSLTHCEWKGKGRYYHLQYGDKFSQNAAWYYPEPNPTFKNIKNFIAFYPSRVDSCYVDGEKVIPQPGEFYGGWITSKIKGPFKGIENSWGW